MTVSVMTAATTKSITLSVEVPTPLSPAHILLPQVCYLLPSATTSLLPAYLVLLPQVCYLPTLFCYHNPGICLPSNPGICLPCFATTTLLSASRILLLRSRPYHYTGTRLVLRQPTRLPRAVRC
eukprot:2958853-Rhodomonas_salina.1